MIYLWVINILVSISVFVLWRWIDHRRTTYRIIGSSIDFPLIALFIIVGMFIVPIMVSMGICYVIFNYLSVELDSFSLLPIYLPHAIVLCLSLYRFFNKNRNEIIDDFK